MSEKPIKEEKETTSNETITNSSLNNTTNASSSAPNITNTAKSRKRKANEIEESEEGSSEGSERIYHCKFCKRNWTSNYFLTPQQFGAHVGKCAKTYSTNKKRKMVIETSQICSDEEEAKKPTRRKGKKSKKENKRERAQLESIVGSYSSSPSSPSLLESSSGTPTPSEPTFVYLMGSSPPSSKTPSPTSQSKPILPPISSLTGVNNLSSMLNTSCMPSNEKIKIIEPFSASSKSTKTYLYLEGAFVSTISINCRPDLRHLFHL